MDPCKNLPFLGLADPVAATTHLAALGITVGAALPLLRRAGPGRRVTTGVFLAAMCAQFTASTAYHAIAQEPLRAALRQIDHALIYVMIAGTFTPIVAHRVVEPLRTFVLATVWLLAIAGIALKTLFFHAAPESLDTALFLGMGWFGMLPCVQIAYSYSWRAALWLPAGGCLYSAGALSELFGWPIVIPGVFGFHEVFHLAVMGGAAVFYAFVSVHVMGPPGPPVSTVITRN